jgi:hypothetical protein
LNPRLYFLVASESFIGHEHVQNKDIPVINVKHLIEKVSRFGSFTKLTSWLEKREYLPTEGNEFSIIQEKFAIGPWSLLWPGIDIKMDVEYT